MAELEQHLNVCLTGILSLSPPPSLPLSRILNTDPICSAPFIDQYSFYSG